MQLFWETWTKGIKLILSDGDNREEVGGVRETKHGYDAWAKTFGYDPGRAIKGLDSLENEYNKLLWDETISEINKIANNIN